MLARRVVLLSLLSCLSCREVTTEDVCNELGIRACRTPRERRPLACGATRGAGEAMSNAVTRCEAGAELGYSCEEEFLQPDGADVIWVIDNSASMTDEIEQIRQNINTFADHVASSGLDMQVVFVTKRGVHQGSVNEICAPEPLAGPQCGDSEHFLHIDAEVGSNNPPDVLLGVLPSFRDQLRTHSRKSIIFVTDDNARMGAGDFLTRLGEDEVMAGAVVHGVIGQSKLDCATIAAKGAEYEEMASRTRGLIVPICCDSYEQLAQTLGEEVASSTARFPLAREPNLQTLEVFFQDNEGRRIEVVDGWAYDAELRAIVFEEEARPEPGTVVVVRYFSS